MISRKSIITWFGIDFSKFNESIDHMKFRVSDGIIIEAYKLFIIKVQLM